MNLEIGCGPVFTDVSKRRTPDTIGLDLRGPASVHASLTANHLPFRDDSFDNVWAQDVVEHVRNEHQFRLWNEIHRVLIAGGRFEGMSPGMDLCLEWAVRDPTHVFYITRGTFEYLAAPKDSPLGSLGYHYGREVDWRPVLLEAVPQDRPGYWHWIFEAVK